MKNITGIILAGGKSSRMGEDKGVLLLQDKPMIQYVIEELQKVTDSILIIANNKAYQQFNLPIFEDLIKDKGPIGGIYTGLSYSKTEQNLCISCDTPNLPASLLKLLINQSNNHQITIPRYNNKLHPLSGVYTKDLIPFFEAKIKNNELKLKDAIIETKHNIIDITPKQYPPSAFYNMNCKEDLKRLKL